MKFTTTPEADGMTPDEIKHLRNTIDRLRLRAKSDEDKVDLMAASIYLMKLVVPEDQAS